MNLKKTVTPRKLAANRANAQKSSGPKTIQGKRNSRFNATQHGLAASLIFVAGQVADESLAALAADLHDLYAPHGPVAELFVDMAIADVWRQRQGLKAERRLIENGQYPFHREGNLDCIVRYNTASRRTLEKTLESLAKLGAREEAEAEDAAEDEAELPSPSETGDASQIEEAAAVAVVPDDPEPPDTSEPDAITPESELPLNAESEPGEAPTGEQPLVSEGAANRDDGSPAPGMRVH